MEQPKRINIMKQAKTKTNFRQFFLLLLFISVLLPLVILGSSQLFVSSKILRSELSMADKRQIRILADRIGHYLEDPEMILNIVAKQLELSLEADALQIQKLLQSFTESHQFILGLQIANEQGIVTAKYPYDSFIVGSDISGHDYFKQINKNTEAYWSPSSMSELLDTPGTSVSIPYEKGIITAYLSLGNLNEIVRDEYVDDSETIIYVTDQQGVFISHPDLEKVLLQEYDSYFNRTKALRVNNVYSSELEYEGQLYNAYSIIIEPSLWMVALYQPLSVINNPVRNLIFQLILLTICIAIVALIFGNYLRKSISEPLNTLMTSTQKIADGSYNILIPDVSFVELSHLAKSIEHMAGDIKNRENALKRSQIYLTNIIDSMPSKLIGVSPEVNITQWNRQIEHDSGVLLSDARGRQLSEIIPRLSFLYPFIEKALIDKMKQSLPSRVYTNDGVSVTEEITIYPLIADSVRGAVILIDDITEKVYLEEMIIQNEKMLSVGGLAAGMAHEINNPLAGMIQTANVLSSRLGFRKELPANEKAAAAAGITMDSITEYLQIRDIHKMLDRMNESGQRMASIVNNMLSFARTSESSLVPYSLSELIDKTLELSVTDYDLKKQYDFKQISVIKEYSENMPLITFEKSKLQQVLFNILQNGAHAMIDAEVNSPEFVIKTYFLRNKNMITFEIEDNGPGLEETIRKRIFEPFFTTKPEGVGTGLGLSVSYFIISENFKGEMSVQSIPGEGARFIVSLPLNK